MKKFFIIFVVIILAFILLYPANMVFAEESYYYTTNVDHLFTHCLIAHPEIAFKENNHMKKHLDADCITATEFSTILNSLNENNYTLVSIKDCYEVKNGVAIKKKVKVKSGKKPLILSFDDVNYDSKKQGLGMVDKIIIDKNNILATQTKTNDGIEISYSNEFVTILENFINKHPDFSTNGAKGTINLTGYDGILGYRTSHTNTQTRKNEIESAKRVVQKLKNLGWTFASHSYGHYHMKKISNEKFKNELELWKNEVEPLVGKTDIYVYPYGEWEVFNNGEISEKHQLLTNYGFKLFCGVGMKSFYSYLPNKNSYKVLFMDRKCIDGNTLRANHPELKRFFNPLGILDR